MKAVALAIKVNRKRESEWVMNKIKSEKLVAASAVGHLSVGGDSSANQSLKQTGVVSVCFLRVQCAAA